IDKAIDKGIDKGFGKDVGKDIAKDLGKGAVRKFGELFKGHGRNDSSNGGNETASDSSRPLAAPVQLSPFQGEQVRTQGNRVKFAWTEVEGAAGYTVEIEARSGKNWTKLEKKSGLLEAKYSTNIGPRAARWRVHAV